MWSTHGVGSRWRMVQTKGWWWDQFALPRWSNVTTHPTPRSSASGHRWPCSGPCRLDRACGGWPLTLFISDTPRPVALSPWLIVILLSFHINSNAALFLRGLQIVNLEQCPFVNLDGFTKLRFHVEISFSLLSLCLVCTDIFSLFCFIQVALSYFTFLFSWHFTSLFSHVKSISGHLLWTF